MYISMVQDLYIALGAHHPKSNLLLRCIRKDETLQFTAWMDLENIMLRQKHFCWWPLAGLCLSPNHGSNTWVF